MCSSGREKKSIYGATFEIWRRVRNFTFSRPTPSSPRLDAKGDSHFWHGIDIWGRVRNFTLPLPTTERNEIWGRVRNCTLP